MSVLPDQGNCVDRSVEGQLVKVARMSSVGHAAALLGDRAWSTGRSAGASARTASGALVSAVGRLADKAIDRVLLTDEPVTSAADGKRLLAGDADSEALAGDIQRVVVLAVPLVRRLARGARLTRVPWLMVASSAVSIGIAVRTGVRELQVLASLVAHRLEHATGVPSDPGTRQEAGDRSLSRSEADSSPGGRQAAARSTHPQMGGGWGLRPEASKRATRALDAAERFDAAALSAHWDALRRPQDEAASGTPRSSAN